jgi:ubiquitin C-terminal hydrolase
MRSNLVCNVCNTESSTYDIFSNIPVPLPEPTQQTISIIIYRLPNKIKDILKGKI